MLRSELTKTLYKSLKYRDTNITISAEVVDIETHAEGVRAHLHNGNIVNGSIVIGADGVHSRVRKIMCNLAGELSPEHMASNFHGIFS